MDRRNFLKTVPAAGAAIAAIDQAKAFGAAFELYGRPAVPVDNLEEQLLGAGGTGVPSTWRHQTINGFPCQLTEYTYEAKVDECVTVTVGLYFFGDPPPDVHNWNEITIAGGDTPLIEFKRIDVFTYGASRGEIETTGLGDRFRAFIPDGPPQFTFTGIVTERKN